MIEKITTLMGELSPIIIKHRRTTAKKTNILFDKEGVPQK